MRSAAKSVAAYLASLPPGQRAVVAKVRRAIRRALPRGYEEAMNWGMIAWQVPLARYQDTYNGQPLLFAALTAQKNNYALYLMCIYQHPKWLDALRAAYRKLGRKPDMGKSCIRFKRLEDLPLSAVAKIIASVPVKDFIAQYKKARAERSDRSRHPSPVTHHWGVIPTSRTTLP
jgi:uncharacterized protein YdhG (YjbR/CyaY superfamily)